MSMVTGLEVNASARCGGSSFSIGSVTAASPDSTARHCSSVKRRASPVAVLEARPGTGDSACPAASARTRSSPTRKSCPASCADANPTSSSPAPSPLSRNLIGPTAASSNPITSSRSTNSVTATIPPLPVRLGSGAPTRTRPRLPKPPRILLARWVPPYLLDKSVLTNRIVPGHNGTIANQQRVSPTYSRIRVRCGAASGLFDLGVELVARGVIEVLTHDRLPDDGQAAGHGLGEIAVDPGDNVSRVDHGRVCPDDLDRGFDMGEPFRLIGPDVGHQPQCALLGQDVNRIGVAAASVFDRQPALRNPRVGYRAAAPGLVERNGRDAITGVTPADDVAVPVAVQVQARARAQVEQPDRKAIPPSSGPDVPSCGP